MYAKVVVDISHENVDRPFEYRIPDSLLSQVEVGCSVEIPFGKGDTRRKGYVIELTETPEFDPEKIKDIAALPKEDVATTEIMIKLAWWMKHQYGSTMINALKTVLPNRVKKKALQKKEIIRLMSFEQIRAMEAESIRKHQNARARLLHELAQEERIPYELVRDKLHIASATIQSLCRDGAIEVEEKKVFRNPVKSSAETEQRHTLSAAQQRIVDQVRADMDADIHQTYLIHGITGSGKTEVYMELIRDCVERGKQAIVLIPEIALTYQTLLRFYKRFGDRVSVMNSTLSPGEKYDQCERARQGDIDIIIGPRSALFTPFPNLGLILIDEEHEATYKSEQIPKYHARETAIYLASLHQASVVLGSATPSMESYYKAKNGEYKLFELTERLTGGELAEVELIDLRQELKEGNRSIFSRSLQDKIQERLDRKEQTMLFLNRRGYAGFVSCRACGHVMKCPHCDVSLSEHKGSKMVCHYCGYTVSKPALCPECGSKYILGFKAGTEAVEEKLHEMYPQARVLRMDADTTKTKESYEKILSEFANGGADILLGTQMIVKGHDFPNVTLVGALAADLSLFAGDYRSAERTFQLLTQAAGRAGRGERKGQVVIQSYQPEHYALLHAANQDYEGFYEEELLYRDFGSYPPVGKIMAMLITATREDYGLAYAKALVKAIGHTEGIQVMGPTPATLSKLQDLYRFTVYVKAADEEALIAAKDAAEAEANRLQRKTEQVQFDLEPMSGY